MKKLVLSAALMLSLPALASMNAHAQTMAATAQKPVGVLSQDEVQDLMPATVFFSKQSATVQIRNSSGVRFADGSIVLMGLVDTGGYSTSVRERYQFYVLTDSVLTIGGKRVAPGAYGAGFVGGKLIFMDLSATTLFEAPLTHDAALARPRPLQIVAGKTADEFQLYLGRDAIAIQHIK